MHSFENEKAFGNKEQQIDSLILIALKCGCMAW